MSISDREKPPIQILHTGICRHCGDPVQQWERLGQRGSWMHPGGTVFCTVTHLAEPIEGRA